jgi:hypothetical protein
VSLAADAVAAPAWSAAAPASRSVFCEHAAAQIESAKIVVRIMGRIAGPSGVSSTDHRLKLDFNPITAIPFRRACKRLSSVSEIVSSCDEAVGRLSAFRYLAKHPSADVDWDHA